MRKIPTSITIGLLLVAFFILRDPRGHSNLVLALGYAAMFAGLMVSLFTHQKITPEESIRRFRRLLDIQRPEETTLKVFELVGYLVFLMGSIALFLHIGSMYVLLDERLYLGLLYALPVFLLASFLFPQLKRLNRYPLVQNLGGRLGICVPAVALLFSLALAFNCARNNSTHTKILVCLAKRSARYRGNASYYIRVRPWGDGGRDVELSVPKGVYDATPEGGDVQITTGIGRLGLEWIRSIDVLQTTTSYKFLADAHFVAFLAIIRPYTKFPEENPARIARNAFK